MVDSTCWELLCEEHVTMWVSVGRKYGGKSLYLILAPVQCKVVDSSSHRIHAHPNGNSWTAITAQYTQTVILAVASLTGLCFCFGKLCPVLLAPQMLVLAIGI